MTAGREFVNAILAQDNTFERSFFEWIESYNGKGALDILEAFGETMLVLDRFIDCRWGCDDDHPEKHLLATCVSHIRAILPLAACGYPSEAVALCRSLGETGNLIALLTISRDELEAYRLGNKKQRRGKFSAGKVRGMLKREGFTAPQNERIYGLFSDYLHPNALDHIFAHRTSHEGERFVIPCLHRDLCMAMFASLVVAADSALLFWACVQGDASDSRYANAVHKRIETALLAFSTKMAHDPTVERGLML